MTQTLLKLIANYSNQLRYAVNGGDTTATLFSNTDEDGNVIPSGLYGFTIDSGSNSKEFIVCTVNGTAITDVVSINLQGGITSGFSNYHRPNAPVEITDWAALYRINSLLDGTNRFDADTSIGYDEDNPAGLSGGDFASVAYVLSVVSGGSVTFSQQVAANQISGETIAVNDYIYFKESDGRWYKVDADDTTTFQGVQRGFAKNAATVTQSLTVAISGPTGGFSGLTVGKYYASNTAGAIQTTPGTNSVFVGYALTTSTLLVNPIGDISFISSSDGAADEGKVPRLNDGGHLDSSFFKNPIVITYLNAVSPATWTKPDGLSYVIVEVQAAGGNGASATSTDRGAGGGGAGGYGKKLISAANLGATETVTIGAIGAQSSFGSHIVATNGTSATADSANGGAGGGSTGGDLNIPGQSGSFGKINTSSGWGGKGGDSFLGSGGPQVVPAADGLAGSGYGSGGSGGAASGTTDQNGGSGAPAIVILTEYYN